MKRKQLPETEIISKYNSNISIITLSKEYNCGQGRIKRILDNNNVHIRGRSECQLKVSTFIPDSSIQEVTKLYNSGMSTRQLAKHYNCNRKYISDYMKRNNIIMRKDYADSVRSILKENKDLIINMYNKSKSIAPISKYFNCSEWAIQHFMDDENIDRKHRPYKVDIPLDDIDKLYKLHHEKDYSMQQLADLYNCTPPTIMDFFDSNNVKRRTLQEANILSSGSITTFNNWKRSCYRHKSYTLPSGKIIKLQGYEPQFLDYIFENNIYKEEDFEFSTFKLDYEFSGKKHYYFPDFKIPKDNLIIEVKSSYILKRQGEDKNKAKRDATIKSGYNYLMVLDNNFEEIHIKG
jgi:intein-encoded DNA endonuclease-like protein